MMSDDDKAKVVKCLVDFIDKVTKKNDLQRQKWKFCPRS